MADTKHDDAETWSAFKEAVNMTASALEKFLDGDDSKSVGQKKDGDGESTGHASGRRIVEILKTKKADLTDDDYAHMRKVVGYVNRHLKQGGPDDKEAVKDSPWRLSLMNWGHDPLKTQAPGSGFRSARGGDPRSPRRATLFIQLAGSAGSLSFQEREPVAPHVESPRIEGTAIEQMSAKPSNERGARRGGSQG